MFNFIRYFGQPMRTIKIVYKSGHVEVVKCREWEAAWNNVTGQFTSIKIVGRKVRKDAQVAFGVHNIESIWEV